MSYIEDLIFFARESDALTLSTPGRDGSATLRADRVRAELEALCANPLAYLVFEGEVDAQGRAVYRTSLNHKQLESDARLQTDKGR